jgi:hypothetical protein
MSTLMNQARNKVPRIAEAAVERARLTVVPRSRSSRAARVPFMALMSLLLVAGVGGLLYFNTSMQQVSFTATELEDRATALDAERQGLQMDLDTLRNPQRVALQAKELGMVPQSTPAFVRLSDGTVLGTPVAATADDAIRLNPLPTRRPKNLIPPVIKKVITPNPAATGGAEAGSAAPATGLTAKKPGTGGAAPRAGR